MTNHCISKVFQLPKLTGNRLYITNTQRSKKVIWDHKMWDEKSSYYNFEQVTCPYITKRNNNNNGSMKKKVWKKRQRHEDKKRKYMGKNRRRKWRPTICGCEGNKIKDT